MIWRYSTCRNKAILICGLALFIAVDICAGTVIPDWDMGFLGCRDRTTSDYSRMRLLGPTFEFVKAEDGRCFAALRPFYAVENDPSRDRLLRDMLWPVGMYKTFKGEVSWRLFPFFGYRHNEGNKSYHRCVGFPFFFSGRTREGKPYVALFPVGGIIRGLFASDRIMFVLFPLYVQHRSRDVVSHEVLFPILSWTTSRNVHRFRLFPFYSRSANRRRAQANTFVMWPIWSEVRYKGENPGWGFVLFPICGYARRGASRSWMILPPLFRYSVKPEQKQLNAPWPLVQYSSGSEDKLYIWPFWGKKRAGRLHSWFFMWPVVTHSVAERKEYTYRSFSVIPLLTCLRRKGHENGDAGRGRTVDDTYFKLWPLFSYECAGSLSRLRIPALWPGKSSSGLNRNLAPLWTVYSRSRDGGRKDSELFWGLIRHASDTDGSHYTSVFPVFSVGRDKKSNISEWSFLKGLVGYRREGLRKQMRMLYFLRFSFGKKKQNSE